jgi:hypothetical protein
MYFKKFSDKAKNYSKNWKFIVLNGISIAQYHFDIFGQSLYSPFLPEIMQTGELVR